MEAIESQLQQRAWLQVATLVQAQPPAQGPCNQHVSTAISSVPLLPSLTVASSNRSAKTATSGEAETSMGALSPSAQAKAAYSRSSSQIKRAPCHADGGLLASTGPPAQGIGVINLREPAGEERHNILDASRSPTSSPCSGSDNSLHSRFSASDILHGLGDVEEPHRAS